MTNALLAAIVAILLIAFMPTVAVILLVLAVLYGCVCWRGAVVARRFRSVENRWQDARNELARRARREGWPTDKLKSCLAYVHAEELKSQRAYYQR